MEFGAVAPDLPSIVPHLPPIAPELGPISGDLRRAFSSPEIAVELSPVLPNFRAVAPQFSPRVRMPAIRQGRVCQRAHRAYSQTAQEHQS
jgi:hypothetical protein